MRVILCQCYDSVKDECVPDLQQEGYMLSRGQMIRLCSDTLWPIPNRAADNIMSKQILP